MAFNFYIGDLYNNALNIRKTKESSTYFHYLAPRNALLYITIHDLIYVDVLCKCNGFKHNSVHANEA